MKKVSKLFIFSLVGATLLALCSIQHVVAVASCGGFENCTEFSLSDFSLVYRKLRHKANDNANAKRWTQGATITENYYVYTLVGGDPSRPGQADHDRQLWFVDRNNASNYRYINVDSMGIGHMNNITYDWGNHQLMVLADSAGTYGWAQNITGGTAVRCFDISSNLNSIKEAQCKAYGPRAYHTTDITNASGQGNAVVNNLAYVLMYPNTNDSLYIKVCPSKSECKYASGEVVRTIVVKGYSDSEIEDIAFDASGNMYLIFNKWGVLCEDRSSYCNYTEYYKLDASKLSALGLNTVPTGSASTIGYDGSTGGDVVPPATQPGDGGSGGGGSVYSGGTVKPAIIGPQSSECANVLTWLCENTGNGEKTVADIIRLVVNIMTAGVTVLGTIGILICGYMILTAKDNEAQVTKARKRLVEIVIGIVAFVLIAVGINLLLPKGNVSDVIGVIRGFWGLW